MPDRHHTILVIDLLGGLGDLLILLPALRALSLAHPTAGLHVLTHAPADQLLAEDDSVRATHTAPRGRERDTVARLLQRLGPDLVVSTTRHGGIPDLVAATGCRAVTDLWRDPPADRPVGLRYLDILRTEGLIGPAPEVARVHLTSTERRRAARTIDAAVGGTDRPVLLLPTAGMPVKEWPITRWAALATGLADSGSPVLACAERPLSALPGTVVLPPAPLRELAAWCAEIGARHGVVVGGDTGPLRLAEAVGARTVALFGPSTGQRYGLATGTNLQGLPDCPHRRPTAIAEQPCWWTAECPLSTTGPACLADLTEERVRAAVLAELGREDGSPV